MQVGSDIQDDIRRARILRETIGPNRKLMMDANQKWDVDEAIENMKLLAEFDPWWIEEPTNPDDILGHAKIAEALRPLGIGVVSLHSLNTTSWKICFGLQPNFLSISFSCFCLCLSSTGNW